MIVLLAFFILAPVLKGAVNSLSAVVLLLSLVLGWKGLRMLHSEQKLVLAGFAAYVALSLLSMINNENLDAAGWRFERYHPFLFATLLLGMFVRIQSLSRWLLPMLAVSAAFMGGFALYQQGLLGAARVGYGTGLNPNIYGHLASLLASLLLIGSFTVRAGPLLRLLFLAAAMLAVYAVLGSGSRGALIALLLASGVAVLVHIRGSQSAAQKRRLSLAFGGLLVILLVTMVGSSFWGDHWQRLLDEPQRFLQGDYRYSSFAHRAVMLLGAWDIWLQHPLLGTGLGDFSSDFEALMQAGRLPPVGGETLQVFHNIFADALATTGLMGTVGMLLGVFFLPMRLFVRVLRESASDPLRRFAGLGGLVVTIDNLIFGLTNSWLYLRGLPFVLILLLLMLALTMPPRAIESNDTSR